MSLEYLKEAVEFAETQDDMRITIHLTTEGVRIVYEREGLSRGRIVPWIEVETDNINPVVRVMRQDVEIMRVKL